MRPIIGNSMLSTLSFSIRCVETEASSPAAAATDYVKTGVINSRPYWHSATTGLYIVWSNSVDTYVVKSTIFGSNLFVASEEVNSPLYNQTPTVVFEAVGTSSGTLRFLSQGPTIS